MSAGGGASGGAGGVLRPYRPGQPPFAGGGTFCHTDLVPDPEDLRGADVAVVGAPFDEGVSHRPGARFGPREIRLADDMGWPSSRPHLGLGVDPFAELRVVDHGDIEARPACLDRSHAALQRAVAGVLAAGAAPFVLGGDHSLSAPVLRAMGERFGPGGYAVIHFDAHADTGSDEPPHGHGASFRTAVLDGALRGDHIVQVGLRGYWPPPKDFDWMRAQGFRWHTMEEIADRGVGAVVADAVAHVAARAPRVYLTVDIDVLDPAFAPGTGTPVPGGLTSAELLRAVRAVSTSVDLCGMDLVEVSPPYDPAGVTALAGHHLLLEALCGMALRRAGRPPAPQRAAAPDQA